MATTTAPSVSVAPTLTPRPAYPIVVAGQSTTANVGEPSIATKLVDTYVEAHPKVVATRQRHAELMSIFNHLCGIGVGPATLGVIVGLGATADALQGGGSWWLAGGCGAVIAAGSYVTWLSGRFWNAAIDPAKAELDTARAEVRGSLEGPEDVQSVAKQLTASTT